MKALLTGMNGTVAPALAQVLDQAGHSVVAWDRSVIPIDDPEAARMFICTERPDWFFHLATGPADWATLIAHVCASEAIRLLYTSSVSVFSASQQGPFTVKSTPQPDDDYGRYKLDCEQRVQAAHSDALIVRLGWQIGSRPGGNHMVSYLHRTCETQGQIGASMRWIPACSFLPDTARSLLHSMQSLPAGLYHLDGNPGMSFHDIALALNQLHGEPWAVVASATPIQNSRMLDDRVAIRSITDYF